jgi:hypothetical protein
VEDSRPGLRGFLSGAAECQAYNYRTSNNIARYTKQLPTLRKRAVDHIVDMAPNLTTSQRNLIHDMVVSKSFTADQIADVACCSIRGVKRKHPLLWSRKSAMEWHFAALKAAISNGSINKSVHGKISEEKSFIYLTYHGSLLVYRIN